MTIRVEVTAEDIRNGQSGYCLGCPVALALQRTFKRRWVSVTPGHYYVDRLVPDKRVRRALPSIARQFIRAFDHSEPVEPFSFEVEVSQRLSAD